MSRPSLVKLNSAKLKRSDSQIVQSTLFPTRLTVELVNVTENLKEFRRYLDNDSNTDNNETYQSKTNEYLNAYSRVATAFLESVRVEDSNSYEQFNASVYLSVVHTQDYIAMLNQNLPPKYKSFNKTPLFLTNPGLNKRTQKILLVESLSKLDSSYEKLKKIMKLKVQEWTFKVVTENKRLALPREMVSDVLSKETLKAFSESVFRRVGV